MKRKPFRPLKLQAIRLPPQSHDNYRPVNFFLRGFNRFYLPRLRSIINVDVQIIISLMFFFTLSINSGSFSDLLSSQSIKTLLPFAPQVISSLANLRFYKLETLVKREGLRLETFQSQILLREALNSMVGVVWWDSNPQPID